MVIVTYKPIVALLEQLHVASEVNGITIFNVAQYLKVFASGKRWTDIKGNTAYPSDSRILLWTTNPKESNLGGMLADIAYAAQNGGNSPTTSISPDDPHLPVITQPVHRAGRPAKLFCAPAEPVPGRRNGRVPDGHGLREPVPELGTHRDSDGPEPDLHVPDSRRFLRGRPRRLDARGQEADRRAPVEADDHSHGRRGLPDRGGQGRVCRATWPNKGLHVPNLDDLEKAGVQFSNVPTAKS